MAVEPVSIVMDAYAAATKRLNACGFDLAVMAGGNKEPIVVEDETRIFQRHNSADNFDLTENNFLRFELRNAKGNLCAFQAARLDILGRMTLGEFAPGQYKRVNAGKEEAIAHSIQTNPALETIKGRAVYHGELYISKSASKTKSLGPFAVVAYCVTYLKWQQDYSWCILRNKTVQKRLASQLNMFHHYPKFIDWESRPEAHYEDDWIAFNSAADIEYLASVFLQDHPKADNR